MDIDKKKTRRASSPIVIGPHGDALQHAAIPPPSLQTSLINKRLRGELNEAAAAARRRDLQDDEDEDVFLDVPQVKKKMLLIPPLNFAMVAKGVYRSGYPNRRNFGFLKKLGIKCIVCLSAEEPTDVEIGKDMSEFIQSNNIKLIRVPIEGQKEPFSVTSTAAIATVLRHLVCVSNHPCLLHCDKGKHRTGTVVACLRKLQGWALSSIFDEYSRFCKKSIRILDHQLIEFFEMEFTAEDKLHFPPWIGTNLL